MVLIELLKALLNLKLYQMSFLKIQLMHEVLIGLRKVVIQGSQLLLKELDLPNDDGFILLDT